MSIRTRLTWQFSIIVASILIFFYLAIYFFYADFRKDEYYSRLHKKALTTARLLIDVQEIDHDLLKIIDRNTLNTLHNEKIYIFDQQNKLLYASADDQPHEVTAELLNKIREEKEVEYISNLNESLGLAYQEEGKDHVIIASAFDVYGRRKLVNLRYILIIGFFLSLLVTYLAGRLFSDQVLYPIARINRQVSDIGAENLQSRVDEGNGQDEIAQLAINFNQMLDRIASSFELQKNFVHNASHELRTPLAAMISQLQVGLAKERNKAEYLELLYSVLEDAQKMTRLSNGLLELAQAERDKMGIKTSPLRIDELLFSARQEVLKSNPKRKVELEFSEIPENEDFLSIQGNEGMLLTVFKNLIDNACKFSAEHKACASIAFDQQQVIVSISDQGMGIPEEDFSRIFLPFYRSDNVRQYNGHGLGLSICRKIVDLHKGSISLQSTLGKGSTFQVSIPHIKH